MSHIFISHATKDDAFVAQLRQLLESFALTVWADSPNLRGGNKLAPAINQAIEHARQTIVVISPNTVNSPWVRKEISYALEVERQKHGEGYRVIPLMLPGIEPAALNLWFDEEPVGVKVQLTAGGLMEALPAILAALGEQLPGDPQPAEEIATPPVAELVLKLYDAKVETADGKTRAKATATLIYEPADDSRNIESNRFFFTAPLGPIEADDLRWYLEAYFRWPLGVFKERANRIEASLPKWGQDLYAAALASQTAQDALQAWLNAADKTERRFSVMVDSEPIEGASEDEKANANEAASLLLSLPWELLNDGRGFLFHGKHPVRVRRRLPNRHKQDAIKSKLPIRVLLVSPRPEDAQNNIGYIDHRISALPLVAAIEELGALVELTLLSPPTFPALEAALKRQPFDVIHFDGHGVYDPKVGLGALCFEDPQDSDQHSNVDAQRLAEVIRDHRVPLVFLEACQSAQSELDPTTSVAASLLAEGVTSVVAMTHSVLVVTAQRFVTAFYRELARGARVGSAMLAGQQALHDDRFRMQVMGAGALRLQDWFVPVLYQEKEDMRLVTKLPAALVKALQTKQRRSSFGKLLDEKERMQHEFVGRSRDLLKLERMLCDVQAESRLEAVRTQAYVVIRGRGGEGKTTIAVELAHWLTRTNRFDRAAFVSLEQYTDARSVLDAIGQQLLPEGENWSVANFSTLKEALQPVERALRERRTIIVIDNVESLLPEGAHVVPPSGGMSLNETIPPEGGTTCALPEIFQLCRDLLDANAATRIVFTSRELLPEPFHHVRRTVELRELDHADAIELVAEVMKRNGLEPKHDDAGNTPQEIADLISAVGCHARALTLLARWVAVEGLSVTAKNAHEIFAELERKHPGDRENSLYASVELSLRRLPSAMREQANVLAVFHGGATLGALRIMLDRNDEASHKLATALIKVGVAEVMDYGHLRFDPALPPYLLRQLDETEIKSTRLRWVETMQSLVMFLHEELFQHAELSAQLTRLELPNIIAFIEWLPLLAAPEMTIVFTTMVESLLANKGLPLALAKATHLREKTVQKLNDGATTGTWNHVLFLNEGTKIDRLLEQRQLTEAYQVAQQLIEQALKNGENAYPEAIYDIAMAYYLLGLVQEKRGFAEDALSPLAQSRQIFETLYDSFGIGAKRMASAAISVIADCLSDLGQLDISAKTFEEAIELAETINDQRQIAISKARLGNVRQQQQRYADALDAHNAARINFELLGEPESVATAWHDIGVLHSRFGQFLESEQAYRKALAIRVQKQNLSGEANTLSELGNLYGPMGRLEDAITCIRRAVEISILLKDQRKEGVRRGNLANTLSKMKRYDEARREAKLAIECKQPYGQSVSPWKTWHVLYEVEQATGNPQAAAEARERARQSYLAYRHSGGENYEPGAWACAAVGTALQEVQLSGNRRSANELSQKLAALAKSEPHPRVQTLMQKLQAILCGARDLVLAEDESLHPEDAVELQLLLEGL